MFTRRSWIGLWLGAAAALAQPAEPLDPSLAIRFQLPPDAPVAVVGKDLGDSRIQARGGALVLDLRATVTLRNNSTHNIRGLTLVVLAQEMAPGGKGSVAAPSLNVAPGGSFPVRVNLRLLRPLPVPVGPLVEVGLDGVLFADFGFFGPNRLESRRTLTAWEMEARRDRQHLKAVLEADGPEALRQQLLASLKRQSDRPRLDVQVSRGARALSAAVNALIGHNVAFAFLKIPDSPIEPLSGGAVVNGAEASSPRIEVANRSHRPIRYFEVGWVVRDSAGREFLAGTLPAAAGLDLRPGRIASTLQDRSYKFIRPQEAPPSIAGLTGFVSQVEFADGGLWIPSRKALEHHSSLFRLLPVSPEEQRLAELYRTQGLQALIKELGKF